MDLCNLKQPLQREHNNYAVAIIFLSITFFIFPTRPKMVKARINKILIWQYDLRTARKQFGVFISKHSRTQCFRELPCDVTKGTYYLVQIKFSIMKKLIVFHFEFLVRNVLLYLSYSCFCTTKNPKILKQNKLLIFRKIV